MATPLEQKTSSVHSLSITSELYFRRKKKDECWDLKEKCRAASKSLLIMSKERRISEINMNKFTAEMIEIDNLNKKRASSPISKLSLESKKGKEEKLGCLIKELNFNYFLQLSRFQNFEKIALENCSTIYENVIHNHLSLTEEIQLFRERKSATAHKVEVTLR